MKQPFVSVVMTAYNEGKYIEDSVQSILNQSFRNFELVIVDDGSTDDTLEKLELLGKQDERIIVIPQEHSGRSRALNKGISCFKGKYMAIMDSGDIAHSDRLVKEVEFLEQNSDVSVVGTWAYWINENRKIVGEWKPPLVIDRRNVYRAGGTVHSSMMCRGGVFEKIGGYDPRYTSAVDNDLYIRAVKSGVKIANIPEFLIYVTMRGSGICGNSRAVERNLFKIKMKYLPHFLNPRNIIYTLMSFCGWVLPSFLFKSKRLETYLSRMRNLL